MLGNVFQKKPCAQYGTVKCSCGAEIPFVPSVNHMSAAIEAHVNMHKQEIADPKTAQAEADKIRDYLTEKVAEKASASSTRITKVILTR